jgi:glycosyltransferase involved in cell wall biosynthesis
MIENHYVLFTRIPLATDTSGRIYCDPPWAKDLKLHLRYIRKLSVCCPVDTEIDTHALEDISRIGLQHLFDLRPDHGLKSVIKNLIPNFIKVAKACKSADIVHSEGAGWAFPLSFYIFPLKTFLRFKWIIVIESSFWMLEKGAKASLRQRIEHLAHKEILTRALKNADARIFTQSFYRDYFLGADRRNTLINPATWVDREHLVSPQDLEWRKKHQKDGLLKLIFPSRLEENKGTFVVLDAIKNLKDCSKRVQLTIMGAGTLKKACLDFIGHYKGNIEIKFRDPVEYGRPFFDVIAEHDFVIVPTLQQEQPRIIFDAFSQGVPIIGSDTSGIKDITSLKNAFLFSRGNAADLAAVITSINVDHDTVLEMGLDGLAYATGKTHAQMHMDREAFLKTVL